MEGERNGWIMPARWSCATVTERGKLGRIAGGGVKTAWRARARPRSMETRTSKRTARLRARAGELGSAAGARGGAPAGCRGLGRRRALPGSREHAPALATMGARGGQLRPGRRRCRQRQARLGRRYARGRSGRPPRAQASSARRRARVRHARAHRARCQVDARLARTSEGAL
ncbi:hypothetical protein PVAP13_3NG183089 [Panicum virgatum]|uniref:Uncharacterized protein n=2 Tax=Panicum virgatum TaxID=38727 RepID=A0A8T0U9L2_PANVG|nr:hypothetical protein PVAP13_3NG183089 [Panicum virgatum]